MRTALTLHAQVAWERLHSGHHWVDTLKALEERGAGRVLGGAPHIEQDKRIVRDLLRHSVNKNSLHGLQDLYRKIARPLGLGESQGDCYQLLLDLGVLSSETNPCVLRYTGRPLMFPAEVLQEVPRVQRLHVEDHDPDRGLRRDLRKVQAYTVDAATATEIDDAIGTHVDERGQRWVLVHVADPARLLAPHSVLERYAAQRGVSVFLPETHFPLVPQSLSSTVFSINPGKVTHALTFAARVCPATGALLESQIYPSLLERVAKVSYVAVDKMLEISQAPPDLALLHEVAKVRRRFREQRGAATTQVPEPLVSVHGQRISVALQSERSAARSLVEELMIVAGQVAAEFARRHNVPIPYRVQPPSPLNNSNNSNTPKRDASSPPAPLSPEASSIAQIVRSMQMSASQLPAFMDANPQRHASLGLDAYCQVTSPIRRYPDLMAAQQIKAFLRGDPLPFSSWDIMQYAGQYEVAVREAENLQSSSTRFWLLRHLQSQPELQQRLRCVVLPTIVTKSASWTSASLVLHKEMAFVDQVAPVYVLELGLRAYVKMRRTHNVGDVIDLQLHRLNPVLLDLELGEKQ